MTDNNGTEDLAHVETGVEDIAPARTGVVASLTEAWRTKPLFKLMVIVVVVGAVVAVASNFIAPEKETNAQSRVMTAPELHASAGGQVSPYMKHETDLADKHRATDALKSGGSALPTPQGTVTDLGDLDKRNDPLTELKAETEHLREELVQVKQSQKQQVLLPQQASKPEIVDDNLASAMQRQLSGLTEEWKIKGMRDVVVTEVKLDKSGESNKSMSDNVQSPLGSADSDNNVTQTAPKLILPAGTVNYAQLLTEANSDVPGPIMVQILSGPFSGARAVGSFKTMNDYLVLQFTLINFKGKDYTVNAFALDPDTTLAGMATEVDERYFVRVVLPAASAFLEGVGQALSQNNQTIVDNGQTTLVTQSRQGIRQGMYDGLGKAAQVAGQFFENQANQTRPLVRVAAGTPLGLFFVTSVYDKNMSTWTQNQSNLRNGTLPVGMGYNPLAGTGYNPMAANLGAAGAYPGSTVNGFGGQQGDGTSVPYGNNNSNTTGGNTQGYFGAAGPTGAPFSPVTSLPSQYNNPFNQNLNR